MSGKKKFDYPLHPSVDWSTLIEEPGKPALVQTTCPFCKTKQYDRANQVSYRIRKGTFTGCCYKDRLIHKERVDRMPRPSHQAVDWNDTKIVRVRNQRLTKVAVICPKCKQVRYVSPGPIAAKIRESATRFTGECINCSRNAKKRDWIVLSEGRKIDPEKGYIRLYQSFIQEGDKWLFDAMKNNVNYVMEHRFVMAKCLHRPLLSNELVDHMDGNKLNNDPSNLRLYIRGKNMPGETSGYGTYYHEWQIALSRIRELEEQLEKALR